jgi:Arc/MetJ-type ribon-helix-helix transcriptional regulator
MPSGYNLPELMMKEIDALVKAGYYSSKSDVVKDALRTLLLERKNLRLATAVELYRRDELSLGKAAEVADVGIVEFKEILASQDHKRILTVSSRDVRRADGIMKKMR